MKNTGTYLNLHICPICKKIKGGNALKQGINHNVCAKKLKEMYKEKKPNFKYTKKDIESIIKLTQ